MKKKKRIKVQRGDCFCSSNPSKVLGFMIKSVEKIRAHDFHADMSHSGIILDKKGTTFECLWTVKSQNLFKAYKGCKILIARHNDMTPDRMMKGFEAIQKHNGQRYPIWRLITHLFRFSKFIHWERVVCSELVAKFLYHCGLRHRYSWGTNPDTLADEFREHKGWTVVFDGVLE